jgi:cytochrome b561
MATMKTDFSIPQRVLHWLMVVLLAFNLLASDAMGAFGNLYFGDQPIPSDIAFAANVHATIGIAILVLGVLRLCLRFVQGVPPSPAVEPPLLRFVAKLCHFAFYAIFIIMPLAGIGAFYFKNSAAAFAHIGWMKTLLWALIALHVGGVLVHQFYWKTDVLKRMTSGVSRRG